MARLQLFRENVKLKDELTALRVEHFSYKQTIQSSEAAVADAKQRVAKVEADLKKSQQTIVEREDQNRQNSDLVMALRTELHHAKLNYDTRER